MQARRVDDIFKILKGKHSQQRILYPAKLSFRNEGERDFSRQKAERVHYC